MKPQSKLLLMLLLCLTTAVSYSQENPAKPVLFAHLPNSINVSDAVFKDVFNSFEGQQVSVTLANNFVFPGVVLSNEVKYSNLQNIIIRSTQYNNALLQLSKIINDDKSISYTGRIINNKAFDGYEVKRNAEGRYSLQKFETGRILQDCSY